MAEKRYIKGLFKDTSHIDQPEGTWRYAKNMVLNEKMGSISNEGGTELAGHLGTDITTGAQNDKVVGIIEVSDDRAVLFVKDVASNVTPRSEIGIWENGEYTAIFNPSPAQFPEQDLNFQESHPINGTFKVDSKGDLIVYWTDDLNPPRAFNVDRQQRDSAAINQLYGMTNFNHIDILNLFPYAGSVPRISVIDNSASNPPHQLTVGTGGGLRTGVYYLALAYVDDDYVATNFLSVSNPISIVDEYDSTRPTTKKDGIKKGSQTSKSITWRVNNLNTDYKYIRPVVIRKMGEATDAFKLNDVEIIVNNPISSQEILFTGIEGFQSGSVEEVIIDTTAYDTAKTITQLDGILYVGNTTGTKDLGYQKYANNIKLNSIIKTFPQFDEYWATMDNLNSGFTNSEVDEGNYVDDTQSYRYIPNIFKYRGYMRDETYAFYIAFILNDGSMSYAYHIPGRKKLENQSYTAYSELGSFNSNDETDLIPGVLRAFYDEQASLYQFYDLSQVNSGSNSNMYNACRHMQYWENLTELYPNSDNFEVWDENGYAGSIQGDPVRHHHFPSNENPSRCTVVDDIDSVVLPTQSQWTPPSTSHFTGEYVVYVQNSSNFWMNDSWSDTLANEGRINLASMGPVTPTGSNNTPPHDTTHDNHCLIATSPNTNVRIACQFKMHTDHQTCDQQGRVRVRWYNATTGVTATVPRVSGSAVCSYDFFSGDELRLNLGNSGSNDTRVMNSGGYAWEITNLNPGDSVWMEGWGSQNGGMWCNTGSSSQRRVQINQLFSSTSTCAYSQAGSWAKFEVTIVPPGAGDYRDVNLKHEVRALGFELEDIKVPSSIAEKAQGFRIYRAQREYSDRTIIGQDIAKPMVKKRGLIGLCLECTGSADALQGLKPLIDKEETFFHNSAFSKEPSMYSVPVETDQNDQGSAYKNFSFHDFYLLRKKASLAAATHVKVEYVTGDYTWNGPDVQQDKKMLTEIDTSQTNDNGLYKITERWGWDMSASPLNCYPPNMNSAVFMGGVYLNTRDNATTGHSFHIGNYELNRPLGQKAKSYILGDTIFDGEALGLGKIINLHGESHIAFGLRDGWELPTLVAQLDLDGSGTTDNSAYNLWGMYNEDLDMMLVTDNTQLADDTSARHKSYLLNLKAYKTDLYKSIDSNALVWTGFEVLGADFENFIFDEKTGNPLTASTDYSTSTVEPEGIWGGDIFISRYGLAKGLKPLDDQTLSNPEKGVYYHIVESVDNINFRHQDSAQHAYFPMTNANTLIRYVGKEDHDYTHQDKIGYNDNYSAENDIRTGFPLPLRIDNQDDFPTRTHRSAKNDTTSLIDNYRIFLANQFKDLPKNRGELWKLASFNNLLYFHMQESLFAAKGKQSMQMSDGSEAYVGSGDIFQQEPDEMIQTEGGFAGTSSQYAALTTRHGYFFVDHESRKVFLMKDQLQEISNLGMYHWFRENLPFSLTQYGLSSTCADNPVKDIGYHSVWDPKFKRVILTKRDYEPTQAFIDGYNATTISGSGNCQNNAYGRIVFEPADCVFKIWQQADCQSSTCPCEWQILDYTNTAYFKRAGWTISYYPELSAWGSFHDYVPYIYFNTSKDFYSLTDEYDRPVWEVGDPVNTWEATTFGNAGIWRHNSSVNYGILYQENEANEYTAQEYLDQLRHVSMEFEFIHNELKAEDLVHSSFDYTLETFNQEGISVLEHGFTDFWIYNTFQIDFGVLEYLINIRRVGNEWKVNKFRDMARLEDQAGNLNLPNTDPYYTAGGANVTGMANTGTSTTSVLQNMFTVSGMDENINLNFIDNTKAWNLQKKFIDKWVGIRLIYDNISNNLLNLYSTNVAVRKMYR